MALQVLKVEEKELKWNLVVEVKKYGFIEMFELKNNVCEHICYEICF